MSEFRFFAYTDFEYRTNGTASFFNLPFTLSTKSTPPSTDEMSEELNVPYTVFEALVAIFAVVGNLMVIIVFQRERKLRRRTNYYIVSLAMADFLVGSLGVPFAILASVGLPENLYACLFTVSLLVVLCTISIFCLVAVSVDRYWAILYPMAYSRNVRTKTAIVIISMCWVAGTVVGFLPLFGWHADVQSPHTCHFVKVMDYSYLVFLYFATIITPALLMLAFYAHIYRVIVKQVRQIVTMNPMSDCSRRSSTAQMTTPSRPCHGGTMLRVLGASRKRDVKATQNLSIIVLFFMICWFPLYTINCIKAFCPDCEVHPKLTLFCIILSHLNSAGNPVLYAYHLKDFRLALKNLLLKIIGIDVEPPVDPMHRFSLASQHRLQSIDASMRHSLQPRIYIDSPIWLRQQQQQALKNPQLAPKCGVITPCLNNIHQTVAAVASVPTDIERDMWNIMEASSGAEIDEINYKFPDDDDKSSSNTPPTPAQRARRTPCESSSLERCDSPYSYDNGNYFAGCDELDLDEVFLPNRPPVESGKARDHSELNRSLIACAMRNKLRSDDADYQQRLHSSQQALTDSGHSDYEVPPQFSTAQNSPTNGKLAVAVAAATGDGTPKCARDTQDHGGGGGDGDGGGGGGGGCLSSQSSSSTCCLSNAAIYVVESDTSPLSPSHRRKYKKSQRLPKSLTKTPKGISRSCSCASNSSSPTKDLPTPLSIAAGTTTTTTLTRPHSNSTSSNNSLNALGNGVGVAAGDAGVNNNNNNNNNNSTKHHTSMHQANNLNYHSHNHQREHQPKDSHHTLQCHHEKFSPLRAVSQLIFPPIVKHSSLFQLFQPSASGDHATTAAVSHTPASTATPAADGGVSASPTAPSTAARYPVCESRIASADESVCTTLTEIADQSPTTPVARSPPLPPASLVASAEH